jgi:hypothetical protein
MDAWLVIRHNESTYIEKYRLFSDHDLAYAFARFWGYEDPFGMGDDDRPGMMNTYRAGSGKTEVHIGVIHLDTKPKHIPAEERNEKHMAQ